MTQFDDLGLAEPLLRALKTEGYSTPTPIQAQTIPALLDGHDVLGIAQTGTGKTASFVLPLLQKVVEHRKKPEPKRCGALIMTPTRELAKQIADNIRTYSRHIKASVAVVVGGVSPRSQIRTLARGVDIIVATPGRLLDHMNTGAVRIDRTTNVVLDEADQMLDLGFIPAIRKIMAQLPSERQTVLMSATMPKQIRKLAVDFQSSPKEISVAAVSRPIERIAQSVRHVPAGGKRDALFSVLTEAGDHRAIVFTRTKRGADKVSRHLEAQGMRSAAIHGNKSQSQRERTLSSFRSGQTSVLVATDIAARGIDIDDVSHVINFDLPFVAESYVHRIGRTARAGRDGTAISLCDPEERRLLRDIEKLIGNRLEVHGEDPSAGDPAFSEAAEKSGRNSASRKKPRRRKSKSSRPQARSGGPAARHSTKSGRRRRSAAPRHAA